MLKAFLKWCGFKIGPLLDNETDFEDMHLKSMFDALVAECIRPVSGMSRDLLNKVNSIYDRTLLSDISHSQHLTELYGILERDLKIVTRGRETINELYGTPRSRLPKREYERYCLRLQAYTDEVQHLMNLCLQKKADIAYVKGRPYTVIEGEIVQEVRRLT